MACAFSVLLLLAAMDSPHWALPLLGFWLLGVLNLKRFPRRACLLFGIITVTLGWFRSTPPLCEPPPLPSQGFAQIEEVRPRTEGVTVVASTPWGNVQWVYKGEEHCAPGDQIEWQARWYPATPPTVPGAFDGPAWQRSRQLVATGSLENLRIQKRTFSMQRVFFRFRQLIKKRLDRAFDAGESGLLMGLLIGERSGVDRALQDNFQKTGLVHVLAISGYHVVLLAGMLSLFLRSLRLPHTWTRALAMILLSLYVPATGGSAAVSRAVLMFLVVESSWLLQRKSDPLNALGLAMLILMFWNPQQWTHVGFQLSTAATGGILIGQKLPWRPRSKRRSGWRAWWHGYVVEPSWVTGCASCATLPLLIYHFQSFAPIAWLGNLVVVPLVGLGMQAGVLSLLFPDFAPWLYQPFADAATLLFRLGAYATAFLAQCPGAAVILGPWSLPVVVALIVLLCVTPSLSAPNPWGRRLACMALALCATIYAGSGLYARFYPSWTLTALDVGQGDCLHLESPGGRHYLIDTGPPQRQRSLVQDKIQPYLRQQGISTLEALIITHPDADHYGNAAELLRTLQVQEIWTTSCALQVPKKDWQHFLSVAKHLGIPVRPIFRGLRHTESPRWAPQQQWSLTIVHPDTLQCPSDVNSHSIVIQVQGLGASALLTGDLTQEGERELARLQLKSDLLKVGHHGSKGSSSPSFLKQVRASYAWISVGLKNRFHHPHPDVLQRLQKQKTPWISTAKEGSLRARFQKGCYTIWKFIGEWQLVKQEFSGAP